MIGMSQSEITPSGSGPGVIDRRSLASTKRQERGYLSIVLVVSVITWLGLYLQRAEASHNPNVDDYLYTAKAYRLGQSAREQPGQRGRTPFCIRAALRRLSRLWLRRPQIWAESRQLSVSRLSF